MKKITLIVAVFISAMAFAQPAGKGKPEQTKKEVEKEAKGNQKEKEENSKKTDAKQSDNKSTSSKREVPPGKGGSTQNGKPNVEINREVQSRGDNHEDDRDDHNGKGKGKDKDKDKNDNHPGNGHAYGKNKGELSGREFGQQRAAEARAKHEEVKPKTEKEAKEVVRTTVERNDVLLTETERKIIELRRRLEEMNKAGKITIDEMNQKLKTLQTIEKKRLTIQTTIKTN